MSIKFTKQYLGSVSIHFDDIKEEISDMKTFISERILTESVEYMEYAEKAKRKSKDNLIFHPYLATGISNRVFTRLQSSFSTSSFTVLQLLNHFPTKKSIMVVIAYECPTDSDSSTEEGDGGRGVTYVEAPLVLEPKNQLLRKRSFSVAQGKVYKL